MTGPPLAPLLPALAAEPALSALLSSEDATVAVADAARAYVLSGVASLSSSSVIVVATPTAAEAERLFHDLQCFLDEEHLGYFPSWETLPFERVSPSVETMGRRLEALWRVARAAATPGATLLVSPVKALVQRLAAKPQEAAPIVVNAKGAIDPYELVTALVLAGYRREYQVEHRGEVAVRGGIVDVFPSTGDAGIRIDCNGDEVERLCSFDVADQRSVADIDSVEIFACRELLPNDRRRARARDLSSSAPFARDQFSRIADGELFDGMESFAPFLDDELLLCDLLAKDDRVVLTEPRRMPRPRRRTLGRGGRARHLSRRDLARGHRTADRPTRHSAPARAVRASVQQAPTRGSRRCLLSQRARDKRPSRVSGWPAALGDAAPIARRVGEVVRRGSSVVVAASGAGAATRLAEVLEGAGVEVSGNFDPADAAASDSLRRRGVHVVIAALDRGFVMEEIPVAVLAEGDLTGRHRPHRVPKARSRPVEGFFDDLAPGDFVVHYVHGVARYGGMVTRGDAGQARDYLLLEYPRRRPGVRPVGPDRLHHSVHGRGEPDAQPPVGQRLAETTRARARRAVRAVAEELIEHYRRRLASEGHAFPDDTPWQSELEQAFPYPETPDQLRAIVEVKGDMERPVPMDRLVCGDVGFGKTEVALRAAFKAVQDGRQVAVLVPTTILARQHFETFAERFAPYPVAVAMLSRFLTRANSPASSPASATARSTSSSARTGC